VLFLMNIIYKDSFVQQICAAVYSQVSFKWAHQSLIFCFVSHFSVVMKYGLFALNVYVIFIKFVCVN